MFVINFKKNKTFYTFLLSLLVITTFWGIPNAHSKGLQHDILGKWQEIRPDKRTDCTTEFVKDGTIIIIATKDSFYKVGSYSFIDKNRIKISLGRLIGTTVIKLSISEGILTFEYLDGKVERYKRSED